MYDGCGLCVATSGARLLRLRRRPRPNDDEGGCDDGNTDVGDHDDDENGGHDYVGDSNVCGANDADDTNDGDDYDYGGYDDYDCGDCDGCRDYCG